VVSEASVPHLEVLTGDITLVAADAVVNAANETLLGGGGVDGAIHRAAGPELLEACRAIGGCPTGEARTTPGFALPARWVIHTVGPVWRGGEHGEAELLRSCYVSSLTEADRVGARWVAFPAIATGVYGYPPGPAAEVAVAAVRAAATSVTRVTFVVFDPTAARAYANVPGGPAPGR
jgi:O-acetyl-ADP-ribose deacetylase (regulator of RNase III)